MRISDWSSYVCSSDLAKRRVKHIYVANWFFGAYVIAVGLLHVVNNLVMPASLWKSYPVYSGAVDAMAPWWYGHNAVAFLLTVGYLAMMYYRSDEHTSELQSQMRISYAGFCLKKKK